MAYQNSNGDWIDNAGRNHGSDEGYAKSYGDSTSNTGGDDTSGGFIGEIFGGGKKKGGGDFTSVMIGIFIFLFIFGPILFAKFVGWIWGMLLKLGAVGRVITTILMLFAGPFILMFPVMMFASVTEGGVSLGSFGNAILTIIMSVFGVASAIIPAAWYYIWHYDAVKLMGATVFSHIIQNFAKFFWFGFIGAGLISLGSKGFGGFVALAACAAGFIYYFKTTKEYREEALANPTKEISAKAKRTVMMIVAGILVLTAGLSTVGVIVSGIQSKIASAKIASEAAKFKEGDFVEVTVRGASIRMSVSNDAVVKNVQEGDIMTVKGKAEEGNYDNWFIPVEHEGNRGYINTKYIAKTDKKPTVTTTNDTTSNKANAAEEETQNTAEE